MKSTLNKVTVIGAGSWGAALAIRLAHHHDGIYLWDIDTDLLQAMQTARESQRYLPGIPLPEALHIEPDFERALAGSDLVLLVVPSHVFSRVLTNLKPHLNARTYIAWASKGLDPTRHCLLSDVVTAELGARPMAVIAGPSFAKEVAAGGPTVIDLASNDEQLACALETLFNQDDFRLNRQPDFITVQLGGAMKNIVAIAVGMADGLGYGTNAKSALMTVGLNDIARLAKAMGANGEDLMSFSGVGDLILTCTDNQSRNRRFGLALGTGKDRETALAEIAQVVEGLDNIKLALALAAQYQVKLQITDYLQQVLDKQLDPKDAVKRMLSGV